MEAGLNLRRKSLQRNGSAVFEVDQVSLYLPVLIEFFYVIVDSWDND